MSSRTAIAVVLTTLLVAAAGIVGIAMRPSAAPQVAVTPRTPQTISETYSPPPPTAFDRAAAGQKYLSAIGLSNQAQTTMNNMINADMTKPCTCPSGHFNASDALAYLPTFNSLMTQSISQLNALATTLPSTPNEDVTAVAVSLQDVKSQWDTFFTPGQDSQAVVDQLDTTSQRTTGLSAKARSDLGLPPP